MAGPVPSLRVRLLGLLLPGALIALLINVVAVYLIALDASADSLDEGLADAAQIVVETVREQPEKPPAELPPMAQRFLLAMPDDRVFYSLQDAEGHLLAGDVRLGNDLPWGSQQDPAFFDLNRQGYWWRVISIVFEAGGAARHLTLATTALKREQLMREVMLGMVAPQVVLFLLVIALVWGAVARGLAPLAEVRAEIGHRSHQDLRPLDTAVVPAELRPIVAEVNELFGRLHQAIESQRHFIADASHQLRTPIAGLLAQVEASGPAVNPALLVTARRLARLVAQLLALSRAEPGVESGAGEFDLAAMIRDAANDWLPHAFRREIDIEFDLRETWVAGSEHAFREMLANLVDNAIRYGRPAGRIVVRCFGAGDDAVVQVEDDGPGIPIAERPRVFERFYRGAGTTEEGCGLGLSIVRALAQSQGAKVSLGNTPGGRGLLVEIRLPRREVRGSGV